MILKLLCFFVIGFYNFVGNAQSIDDKKTSEKIFTQEEFDKKLNEELMKKLTKVTGDSLKDFAKSLLEKEKELEAKTLIFNKKKQELELIEKSLNVKLKEFRSQQDKIIGCINENEKEAGKRIDHIVKVMSSMKPANAADLLSVQDSTISVKIISKLDPEKVSKIFNLMDKEISARLQKSYINMKR